MKRADSKERKKKRYRKLFWLLIDLAIVSILLGLCLYKPGRYEPLEVTYSKEVSPYLTHELAPQFYNGVQLSEPFDLIVTQEGINEIVAYSKWPKEAGEASFSAPAVLFTSDSIVLMGTVVLKGFDFIVTIAVEPRLNEQGLLNLRAAKVKVGALNLTLIARIIARRMYQQRVAAVPIDKEDWRAKIVASLLNDEPFEPVFKVKDNKVRIKRVTIEQEKLMLRLVPVPD